MKFCFCRRYSDSSLKKLTVSRAPTRALTTFRRCARAPASLTLAVAKIFFEGNPVEVIYVVLLESLRDEKLLFCFKYCVVTCFIEFGQKKIFLLVGIEVRVGIAVRESCFIHCRENRHSYVRNSCCL